MAIAVIITYLIAVAIQLASAYSKDCAVEPAYWCQSLQNAQDCGTLRHCTDTVWQYDEKHNTVESPTACEWCQKILENAHKGIQHLANNNGLIKQSLKSGCRLFPLAALESKCNSTVENYGEPIAALMKAKRYATVCRLMSVCSAVVAASLPQQPTVQEKDKVVNNLDDTPPCMLCHYVVSYLDAVLKNNKSEAAVEEALARVCTILPRKDRLQCNEFVKSYGPVLADLISELADPRLVCRYLGMCQVVVPEETTTKESKPITYGNHQYARIPV